MRNLHFIFVIVELCTLSQKARGMKIVDPLLIIFNIIFLLIKNPSRSQKTNWRAITKKRITSFRVQRRAAKQASPCAAPLWLRLGPPLIPISLSHSQLLSIGLRAASVAASRPKHSWP
jgi:hypothetical protein